MRIREQLLKTKEEVDRKKIKFDNRLKEATQIELIFVASNFEGLTLSQEEAETIVKNPQLEIPLDNKNLLQAKGQKEILDYIENSLIPGVLPIDIYLIKNFHKMLFEKVWPEVAGEWRQENIEFKFTRYLPPHYLKIPEEMFFFDNFLLNGQKNLNNNLLQILEFATISFHEFLRIHPFRDGNGRIARFLFNSILRKFDLPYVIIPKAGTRRNFLQALEEADFGKKEKLIEMMMGFLLESFEFLLKNK